MDSNKPNKVSLLDSLLELVTTKQNVLVLIGITFIAIAIGALAGAPWGLLVLGIGILIWGIVVAVNSKPYRY